MRTLVHSPGRQQARRDPRPVSSSLRVLSVQAVDLGKPGSEVRCSQTPSCPNVSGCRGLCRGHLVRTLRGCGIFQQAHRFRLLPGSNDQYEATKPRRPRRLPVGYAGGLESARLHRCRSRKRHVTPVDAGPARKQTQRTRRPRLPVARPTSAITPCGVFAR